MTTATTPKNDDTHGLDKLRELRDEVRVKLHLASLDAKQEWETKLEPYLLDAEKAATDAGHSASDALKSAVEKLASFRDSLISKAHDATKPDAAKADANATTAKPSLSPSARATRRRVPARTPS